MESSDNVIHRTAEEVHSAACTAGLSQSSQPVQILHFGMNPASNDFKLLQLPNEMLNRMKDDEIE